VFAGFRFPPEVITLAVRWYPRYGLSYRDLEELLGERGVGVDHVGVSRCGSESQYESQWGVHASELLEGHMTSARHARSVSMSRSTCAASARP